MLTRILDGLDLALDAAVAEAARHEDALAADKHLIKIRVRILDLLGVDPMDLDSRIVVDTTVVQCLRNGDIGIRQLDVLADHSDFHFLGRMIDLVDHLFPVRHIRREIIHVELLQGDLVETFALHHQRNLIDRRSRAVLDDSLRLHIAEHRDLLFHFLRNGLLRAADEDVRLDADSAQFLDAMLRRLRLELTGSRDIRQQRDMDVEGVVLADFLLDLADGLEERLALDITDRTADLRDDDISAISLGYIVDLLLDLVRDVPRYSPRRTLFKTDQYTLPVVIFEFFDRLMSMKRS